MKTALPYGILIGLLSGLWIFVLQRNGALNMEQAKNGFFGISAYEYLSVLIPFIGLYFGIRQYKHKLPNRQIDFFQALIQGFRILFIGGVITVFFMTIYLQYVAEPHNQDYMARLAAALLIGILLNLAVSLWHKNYPKNL